MTCIIGHRDGWMVADRRVSFDIFVGPYEVQKIIKTDYPKMLIGCSGVGAFNQVLPSRLRDCCTTQSILEVISDLCRQYSAGGEKCSILVLGEGRLIELDPSGCIYNIKPEYEYWSVGSGSMSAVPYLDGLRKCGIHVDVEIGKETIKYVSTLNTSVGDGVQVETL